MGFFRSFVCTTTTSRLENEYKPSRIHSYDDGLIYSSTENDMRASINRPPTPDHDEETKPEPTLQEIINIQLIESGEKEKLKELLRERLIECGWKDEMKAQCRAFTRKKGRSSVTVDELVHAITPKGRSSVPDSVKAELLQRIRSFLMSATL